MQQVIISLISVYFFVLLGYAAKTSLKGKLEEKTLIYLSVYFLQPMLIFWGLMKRPIDFSLVAAPLFYLTIIAIALIFTFTLGKTFIKDNKDRSIFIIAGLVGNTGNLAIPVGAAVIGPETIPYTTIINIANILFFYTFGVYFYSRGQFSITESLKNVIKIPLIWVAIITIILNTANLKLTGDIEATLEKGAYASIVIQLMVFGIYLSSASIRRINHKFAVAVSLQKFLLLPALGILGLTFTKHLLSPLVTSVIFLQLIVPLAVSNINFAALYNCKPQKVTQLTFVTSILSIIILPIGFLIIENWL